MYHLISTRMLFRQLCIGMRWGNLFMIGLFVIRACTKMATSIINTQTRKCEKNGEKPNKTKQGKRKQNVSENILALSFQRLRFVFVFVFETGILYLFAHKHINLITWQDSFIHVSSKAFPHKAELPKYTNCAFSWFHSPNIRICTYIRDLH
jgi:hypothetical protein